MAALTIMALPFNYPTRTVNGQLVYEYPVKKSEGLYRISVTFGVTQEELLKFNPTLKTQGLKFGQTILVPVKENVQAPDAHQAKAAEAAQAKAADAAQAKAKNVPAVTDSLRNDSIARFVLRAFQQTEQTVHQSVADTLLAATDTLAAPEAIFADTLRLALLLPLQADAQTYDTKMERFLKFYEGALLAIRQEQRTDWKYEIYVYDVGKTDYKLRKALLLPEMQRMHAIIGPAYTAQLPLIDEFSRTHHIPCLLPFAADSTLTQSNRYILQYNAIVPDGMKAIQFKKEEDDNWAHFDELMRTYFEVKTPSQSRPRYDLLGYDLTRYFIPAVLRSLQADTDDEWTEAFLIEHDGLQSTLRFQHLDNGGFANQPIRLVQKINTIDEPK